MTKKLGIVLASVAALMVIAVGSYTYACGGACSKQMASTASTQCTGNCSNNCANMTAAEKAACKAGQCPYMSGQVKAVNTGNSEQVVPAVGGGCPYAKSNSSMSCGSGAKMSNGTCRGFCGMHSSSMASSVCGAKGYYGANVYQVVDGHEWAVAEGKKFEVTTSSPYVQVGNARYYFADAKCKDMCAQRMAKIEPEIDKEAVSLATAEGNVVSTENGQKWAECKVSHEKFLVTADSPAIVMDGQKVYFCGSGCLNTAKGNVN